MTVIGGGRVRLSMLWCRCTKSALKYDSLLANPRLSLTSHETVSGGSDGSLPPGWAVGWHHQFYEHGPMLFCRLPQGLRRWCIEESALGPVGGFPGEGSRRAGATPVGALSAQIRPSFVTAGCICELLALMARSAHDRPSTSSPVPAIGSIYAGLTFLSKESSTASCD